MRYWLVSIGLYGLSCLGLVYAQSFDWQDLGETTYATCSGCHGAEGAGIPGTFPPHAGHLPNIVAQEGGRSYLINTLLYGLSGEISVLGETYNGAMPAWASLSDEQIAAVLNHELHAWGNDALLPEDFSIILPGEVAAARDADLSPEDVLELRNALELGNK